VLGSSTCTRCLTCYRAHRGVCNRDEDLETIDDGLLPRYTACPQPSRCRGSDTATRAREGQPGNQERRLQLELLDSWTHQERPPRASAHIVPRSVHRPEEHQALETAGSGDSVASPALVAVRPWQCKSDSFHRRESPASYCFSYDFPLHFLGTKQVPRFGHYDEIAHWIVTPVSTLPRRCLPLPQYGPHFIQFTPTYHQSGLGTSITFC